MAKIERSKNAARNITFGLVLKLYQITVPFLMRTAMIYFMGVQYLGLNSLFTSVLQVLNLAELGVGSAMVYSMYRPIAEDDDDTICALMQLYKLYYRIIGSIIAFVGLALTPFVPKLINGAVPGDLNVYVLYLMNLLATVLSYWLYAYKSSILQAYQRTDVISKVTILTSTIQYALQLGVILFLKNYYVYVIIALFTQALTNIITAVIATKLYPKYKPAGELGKEEIRQINNRVKDLFTAKIGTVIVNSADTIVISAFLGLTILAVYQNYYFILTAVIGTVTVIFTSCTAGIGNSLIIETKEKNYLDLKKFTFLISWISTVCSCCFLCLYQPFMLAWVGKDLLLPFSAVICLVIYYYVYEINQLLNLYKDAGGIWHEDRFRPLATALTNLVLNLIMVQKWGIYGVLLSTVLSMLIVGMPWLFHNLFNTLFDMSLLKPYLINLVKYTVVAVITCGLSVFITSFINMGIITTIIIRISICVFISISTFIIVFKCTDEYKECIILVDRLTKYRFKIARTLGVEK